LGVTITYKNKSHKSLFKATITHMYLGTGMSCLIRERTGVEYRFRVGQFDIWTGRFCGGAICTDCTKNWNEVIICRRKLNKIRIHFAIFIYSLFQSS
tara:strand:+ start:520 stop:810 length:291 start_codon:yes stop_codon:yes gene_type:complete